jgi:Flp pilus assembly pilin Flp
MKPEKIGEVKTNKGPNAGFTNVRGTIFEIINNEDGQGLTEYALIVGVIALVCIAAISSVGGNIYDAFFVKIQGWLSSI